MALSGPESRFPKALSTWSKPIMMQPKNQPSPSSQTEESEPKASASENPSSDASQASSFYTCGLANGAFYRFVCIHGIFALHGSRCDARRFRRIVCGVFLCGRPASAWLSGLDPLLVAFYPVANFKHCLSSGLVLGICWSCCLCLARSDGFARNPSR